MTPQRAEEPDASPPGQSPAGDPPVPRTETETETETGAGTETGTEGGGGTETGTGTGTGAEIEAGTGAGGGTGAEPGMLGGHTATPDILPDNRPEIRPDVRPDVRASDRERDATVTRLQVAFAEGRLDDEEFDRRVRAALVSPTRTDLEKITADLPAQRAGATAAVPATPPARNLVAFKGAVRRRGRWRVPERSRALAYKGTCELDLRAAELPGPVTEISAFAYKSHVEVVVPPGVRVEFQVSGYGGTSSDPEGQDDLPADAPVVRINGFSYKGTIRASTRARRQSGT